jgi:uncharacterized protein YceH (UPF0502 family)
MCVLLLRGPQTPGELRGRSERMHKFDELSEVDSTLQKLMKREPPLAKVLPRQPGTKEARYAHLLSGEVGIAQPEVAEPPVDTASSSERDRIAHLEREISELRTEISDLKRQFADFRKQFE